MGWSGYSVKGETWPGPMELRLLGVRGFANKSLGKGFQARARVARACSEAEACMACGVNRGGQCWWIKRSINVFYCLLLAHVLELKMLII